LLEAPTTPSTRVARDHEPSLGILAILDIRDLRCTNCHAPLGDLSSGHVVTCRYCGTPLRVTGFGVAGATLLELTPAKPDMPGWTQHLREAPRWAGSPIELVGAVPGEIEPGKGSSWDVVRSVATFDDFDATATLRLWEGNLDTSHGGLKFRRNDAGLYQLAVSTNGKLSLYYLATNGPHVTLAAWGPHPAVRSGRGEPDTLRVVCEGDRIRAFVNGTLVVSARDGSSAYGSIGLFAQSVPPVRIGCTSIVVREAGSQPAQPAAMPDAGFDLVLLAPAPDNVKIQSIKVVREGLAIGLKEAKDIVERPGPLKIGQPRAALEALHGDLKKLGCKVEIRPTRS
jgi:ribosomal protein L7/L12